MTRRETIQELKKYFDIRELVCRHTFEAFGEKSWQFFDLEFLQALLILRRDVLKAPMIINNWHTTGPFSQRGFRCNICNLTRSKTLQRQIYLTAHANGAAIDATVKGMTAAEARELIKKNIHLFPMRIRCETGSEITWLHFDIYDDPTTTEQYIEFRG